MTSIANYCICHLQIFPNGNEILQSFLSNTPILKENYI